MVTAAEEHYRLLCQRTKCSSARQLTGFCRFDFVNSVACKDSDNSGTIREIAGLHVK